LMVSLEDSQRINLAKTSGSLTLSLRGSEDQAAAGDQTLTIERLLKARGVVLSDEVTGSVKMGGKLYEIRDDGRLVPSTKKNIEEQFSIIDNSARAQLKR